MMNHLVLSNNPDGQEQIDYADCIDLGFKREEAEDSVFFDQYGFEYFWLEKQYGDNIVIEWGAEDRMCTLLIRNESGIDDMYYVQDLSSLQTLDYLLTNECE
jgi:hypothetical protein